MKNTVIILLAITAGALCAVALMQQRKKAEPAPQVEQLKAELTEKEQRIQELEATQQRAEMQSREIAKLSDDIAAQARAREVALSNAMATRAATLTESAAAGASTNKNKAGDFGKMMAGMMKDPEMKKMILEQQRMVMDQLYAPFVKQMNLTPEETEQFKDLLAGTAEQGMELATSMFGGEGATNRTEIAKNMAAQQREQEEKMKALLGEERYAQYQEYQQTVGERAQLNQFRQQFGGANISEQQTEQLLAMMREEKKNVAASTGTTFPGQNPGNMESMFKGDQMEKLIAAQETVNQNVYARAGEVLEPQQLESFARFQTNQLQMLRMGLNMAKGFMGGENGAAPATPGQ
ncbi:MAG TPA: hypothetical protein VN673_02260 [Clostridia bacterium]|nr:hypothetical protein [Clostridia bacterium]